MKVVVAACMALVFLVTPTKAMPSSEMPLEITVEISKRSDNEVRAIAKQEMQWKAAINYPVLISGTESLSLAGLRQELTAYTAAAVNISVIEERWDRENGTYWMRGSASINYEYSLNLINELKTNEALRIDLQRAYEQLDRILTDGIERDSLEVSVHLEAVNAINAGAFWRGDFNASLRAKQQLIEHFYHAVYAQVYKPFIDSLVFEVGDITNDTVTFHVSSPHVEAQQRGACGVSPSIHENNEHKKNIIRLGFESCMIRSAALRGPGGMRIWEHSTYEIELRNAEVIYHGRTRMNQRNRSNVKHDFTIIVPRYIAEQLLSNEVQFKDIMMLRILQPESFQVF